MKFTKLSFNDPAIDSNPSIRKVYKDKAGTLWLGMEYRGLIQYNIETREFDRFIHDPADPSSLSSNRIYDNPRRSIRYSVDRNLGRRIEQI